jgi:O-methyltransferase involved in polyketide biosynthesis
VVAAGHACDTASVFVCEGLLLYLTPPVIEELQSVRVSAGPGSQLALSARQLLPRARALPRAWEDVRGLLLARIGRRGLPAVLQSALEVGGGRCL